MPYPNETADETLMVLRAQKKLPPEVVLISSTPSMYIRGVRQVLPQSENQAPPIAYYNDNGRMKCWSWEPEQKTWRSIGSHYHPPR
jgi:hypothetical protein